MVKYEICKNKIENVELKSEELLFFEKWDDKKQCLEAVKQNGYYLQYVKEQTDEICLEAVKQNGDSLQYVKEQTDEICLEAVKQDGDSLQYVKNKKTFNKIMEERHSSQD